MRAVTLRQFGEPGDVLGVEDRALPQPGPGQVRVRMLLSPINPSDLMVVRGTYGILPALPATPGLEGVGVVEQAGSGLLAKYLVGKRVAVLNSLTGNWGEYAVANARQVIPLSRGLTEAQGATFFVNPATAYILTQQVLMVPRGDWLLQTAAHSMLGRMVIRLGRHFGFRTLNVVRRREQVEELRALGADAVFVQGEGDLREWVLSQMGTRSQEPVSRSVGKPETGETLAGHADAGGAVTGGSGAGTVPLAKEGVRFAIDPVGGATAAEVVRCLGQGGRLVLFGTLSGDPICLPPRELMSADARLEGFWLGHWMSRQSLWGKLRLIRTLTRLIQAGVLTTDIAATYSLDEIQTAVRQAERSGSPGKILLRCQRS